MDSYSISPAIGNGLLFDTTTGTISGTPTATAEAITYIVTATNATGSDDAMVSITVTEEETAITGIEELEGIAVVYPNPTQGMIYIHSVVEEVSYTLSDSRGNVVKKGTLTPSEESYSIDISTLAEGLYLLYAKTSKGSVTKKVIKQ